MKNFSFFLFFIFSPLLLFAGENRVDQYPPYTNIRLMGPPNTPASILNDIYIDGPQGGGVLGYVQNPNDPQFISQNAQMISLLSLMAYSGGEGIPQGLYIEGDSLGIDGGNKVLQRTWGNQNDTIDSDRVIYLPSDKSFMIQSGDFGFRMNTPYGEGGRFSGFTSYDTILGVRLMNGQIYEMSDTNLAVFDSKSNINAIVSGNPFPIFDPDAYGTAIYHLQSKEIQGSDSIVAQRTNYIEKSPGVFILSTLDFSKEGIVLSRNDIINNRSYLLNILGGAIMMASVKDDQIVSSISLDSIANTKGAFSNTSTQTNTSGGSDTILSNVRTYLYNPTTLQSSITLDLPETPADGQYITIIGGGTLTVGNVISGVTLEDHNGNSVIGFTNSDMQVGPLGTFQWIESADRWYQVSY